MSPAPASRPPLIGITADSSDSERSGVKTKQEAMFSLAHRYCDAVQKAGGLPVIIPHSPSPTQIRQLLQRVDGLVISGGDFDIDPSYYGEEPIANLGKIKAQRTFTEMKSIAVGLRRDLPMLGICGGAQAINVALGGSLYQDIATQLPHAREHQRNHSNGHVIKLLHGTLLQKIFNRQTIKVNTTHHQAIRDPGKDLIVNARAPDGLIEGIESTKHSFVLGVQWHPEVLAQRSAEHRKLFSLFIAICKRLHRGG